MAFKRVIIRRVGPLSWLLDTTVKTKSRFKKYLVRGLAASVVFVAIGYISAWLSLSQCQTLTQQALVTSNLKSRNFNGDVITYKDVTVKSEVTLPFVVESYYWVPEGFHATYFEYKYVALFGFVKQSGYISYTTL